VFVPAGVGLAVGIGVSVPDRTGADVTVSGGDAVALATMAFAVGVTSTADGVGATLELSGKTVLVGVVVDIGADSKMTSPLLVVVKPLQLAGTLPCPLTAIHSQFSMTISETKTPQTSASVCCITYATSEHVQYSTTSSA
jgi:hypothetical protein